LQEKAKITLKALIPIVIGIGVFIWLFHDEISPDTWKLIKFTPHTVLAIILAWIFMLGRDFGLTWRFKTLTCGDLTWKQALKVDMMCEFTSAVTPTPVGGSAMGMVYLAHEGIDFGRAATLTLTTFFLDELFFTVACPVIMLLTPPGSMFSFSDTEFMEGVKFAFWTVYAGMVTITAALFIGIFIKPQGFRHALMWAFSCRLLSRWQPKIDKMTLNILATSDMLRHCSAGWWAKVFCATGLLWTSRFLVVNALFLGFAPDAPQAIVFCRQFVTWLVLVVSPTPGGSGVSEWLFTGYYGDLVGGMPGVALIIAVMWRVVSYYIYLLLGIFVLPSFLSKRKQPTIIKTGVCQEKSSPSSSLLSD